MCVADTAGSAVMYARSAAFKRGCRSGFSYTTSHATSQPKPSIPVRMNAQYQPKRTVMKGTVIGVITAPILVPALNSPVANARSRCGNHSATVLIAAGKFPDSPSPRTKRTRMNPATDEDRGGGAEARDFAGRHGGQRPDGEGERKPALDPQDIHHAAREQKADRV